MEGSALRRLRHSAVVGPRPGRGCTFEPMNRGGVPATNTPCHRREIVLVQRHLDECSIVGRRGPPLPRGDVQPEGRRARTTLRAAARSAVGGSRCGPSGGRESCCRGRPRRTRSRPCERGAEPSCSVGGAGAPGSADSTAPRSPTEARPPFAHSATLPLARHLVSRADRARRPRRVSGQVVRHPPLSFACPRAARG